VNAMLLPLSLYQPSFCGEAILANGRSSVG
jgi:hypothetical protein